MIQYKMLLCIYAFLQLIQRLYDPLEGAVLFDGVDLRDLNVAWLRQQASGTRVCAR